MGSPGDAAGEIIEEVPNLALAFAGSQTRRCHGSYWEGSCGSFRVIGGRASRGDSWSGSPGLS